MDSRSKPGASYVKKEECTSIFPVPSHLVESYGGVLPSKVTFTTDESEKIWNLSVEKFEDQFFFTYGWKEFEEEVDLKSRHFLMYKPVAASSKQKGKTKEEGRNISGKAHETKSPNENKDKGLVVEKRLSFSRVLKKHHQDRLGIPLDFVLGTGLREGIVIKLKDCEGREWTANVTKRAHRISLTGGWCDFVIDNKLMIGNKILFAWHSEGTVETQILERGTTREPLLNFTSKKRKHLGLSESNKTIDHEELPQNSLLDIKSENGGDISEEKSSGADKRWRFTKDLKKIHARSLDLPMSFSMVIGNVKCGEIKLRDRKKRTWPVQVVRYNKCSSFRITSGWIDFLVGNKASVGSKVVLKSIPNCNNVIKARVVDGSYSLKEEEEDHLHAPPSWPGVHRHCKFVGYLSNQG